MIEITEKQKGLIEKVRGISKKIASRMPEIDKTSDFPWDIFEVFRKNHILDLPIPREFKGEDESNLTCCLVLEEIARISPSFAHMVAGHWFSN